MRRTGWLWLTAILVVFAAAGCNMMKGLGKDIHDSADSVQKALEYEMGANKDW